VQAKRNCVRGCEKKSDESAVIIFGDFLSAIESFSAAESNPRECCYCCCCVVLWLLLLLLTCGCRCYCCRIVVECTVFSAPGWETVGNLYVNIDVMICLGSGMPRFRHRDCCALENRCCRHACALDRCFGVVVVAVNAVVVVVVDAS